MPTEATPGRGGRGVPHMRARKAIYVSSQALNHETHTIFSRYIGLKYSEFV